MSIDLSPLRPLHYRAIMIDPPWRFKLYSAKGEAKSPQAKYKCMSLADIQSMPVGQLAAPDCLLWLWATYPMLDVAMDTLKGWGFKYCTGGSWAKQSSTGNAWAFGPGYRLRTAAEPFLIGTIGRPPVMSKSVRNLIVSPVREHSRKPDEAYTAFLAMSEGPRCEIFSRESRPGIDDFWGNEVGKFDAAPELSA